MSNRSENDRLDSWKAIARHLGRSVRTVRRWEYHEGLPVHRHMHKAQASVYAYAGELDSWRARRSAHQQPAKSPAAKTAPGSKQSQGLSIAVLPFTFSGPDAAQAWVADGFTEEMINGFSALPGLRVTSRTSTLGFQNSPLETTDIIRTLGVSHLLEGGIVGDGTRLRINVRLIDSGRDDHLWSRQFTGSMDEVFDIQERIARAVVTALKMQLKPADDRRLTERSLDDLAAWRRLVQARQLALRWRPDTLEKARVLLDEALAIAGDHPDILAAFGRILLQHREAGQDPEGQLLAQAEDLAKRAQVTGPERAGTRVLQGWLAYARGDWPQAIEQLSQALEIDQDDPDALSLLANCLLLTGQVSRAESVIGHLVAVDPLTPLSLCMPGFLHAMEGRFEQAVPHYQAMLERDPGNPVARLFNVWVLFAAGRREAAESTAAEFNTPGARGLAGTLPARVAQCFTQAFTSQEVHLELTPADQLVVENSEMYARFLAEAYAFAGNERDAIAWMNRAVDLGFANHRYLANHDPFFANLADSDDKKALLRRVEGLSREA